MSESAKVLEVEMNEIKGEIIGEVGLGYKRIKMKASRVELADAEEDKYTGTKHERDHIRGSR